MKSQVQESYIQMYSTPNKEKSTVAEQFVRTMKNKIYKYMTSKAKSNFIDDKIIQFMH